MSFVGELKRRKVFRVAVVYAIVGWLLAQIADTIFPILLLPDWLLRAFVILVLLGFPLTLVLAWAFDVRPETGAMSGVAASSASAPVSGIRRSYYVLTGAATLALGLLLGGLLGRVTVEIPEAEDASRTPIQLTGNPENNPVIGSAISPDGKYLAYVEASGLYLRIIQSGEAHRISLPENMRFARSEIDWFPDGTHLLLIAQVGAVSSLYKIAPLGGEARKIVDRAVSAAISPDGSRIAYNRRSFQGEIYLIGPEGENPSKVVDIDTLSIREMGWSPDSRFLLFGTALGEQSLRAFNVGSGDIHIVMRDQRTFQNWRGYLPFHWAPNGMFLYALTEPPPSDQMSNLWQVRLDPDTAQIVGVPEQVTRLTGYNFRDVSGSADGSRIAFLIERNQADVYVGDLSNSGRSLTNVRRFTFDDRDDFPGGWTSDSSKIYFHSERGAAANIFAGGLDGGQPRALSGSLVHVTGGPKLTGGHIQLSPNREWLLFWDNDVLLKIPADGGPTEKVLEDSRRSDFQCPRNVDIGVNCIVSMSEPNNILSFYLFSPEYGVGRKVLEVDDRLPFANWALSPDGERIALVHGEGPIRIIDIETGIEAEFSEAGWQFGEFVDWTADGKGLIMDGSEANTHFMKSLIYFSPETSEIQVLRYEPSQWHVWPKVSPDGKHVAFGLMVFSGNVWMIDEFVSSDWDSAQASANIAR